MEKITRIIIEDKSSLDIFNDYIELFNGEVHISTDRINNKYTSLLDELYNEVYLKLDDTFYNTIIPKVIVFIDGKSELKYINLYYLKDVENLLLKYICESKYLNNLFYDYGERYEKTIYHAQNYLIDNHLDFLVNNLDSEIESITPFKKLDFDLQLIFYDSLMQLYEKLIIFIKNRVNSFDYLFVYIKKITSYIYKENAKDIIERLSYLSLMIVDRLEKFDNPSISSEEREQLYLEIQNLKRRLERIERDFCDQCSNEGFNFVLEEKDSSSQIINDQEYQSILKRLEADEIDEDSTLSDLIPDEILKEIEEEKNDSLVKFSTVFPKRVIRGTRFIIDFVMYQEEYKKILDELKKQYDYETNTNTSGFVKVKLDSIVKVVLTSTDLKKLNKIETINWSGKNATCSFDVEIPKHYKRNEVIFNFDIYVCGIKVSNIKSIVTIDKYENNVNTKEEKIKYAFVSYSSLDRYEVSFIVETIHTICSDMDVFWDVEKIRSAENWKERLLAEITKRNVFYLCWSKNAYKSEWVKREYKLAVKLHGASSVEPIALDLEGATKCPIPKEVKHKQFSDISLYVREHIKNEKMKKNN